MNDAARELYGALQECKAERDEAVALLREMQSPLGDRFWGEVPPLGHRVVAFLARFPEPMLTKDEWLERMNGPCAACHADRCRDFFDELDRHVLATVTGPEDPDCSCGWKAEPYTYAAWQEHVWRSVLPLAERAEATLDAIEAMLAKKKRMGTLFDVQQIRSRIPAPDLPEGTGTP